LGKTRGRRVQTDPQALTRQQEAFIYEYDGHGGNGTRAYLAAYPACRSISAAAANACRLLRTDKIAARVDELRAARRQRLQMDGDEVLGRVALDARADPRELFDEKGHASKGKVYTIENQSDPDLVTHAGHTVMLTGEMKGSSITVSKIMMPAKKARKS
jgi:hypothetical protein